MNKVNISVIIPTKNRPDDLLKAVNSILKQNSFPSELIIVDQSKNTESKNIIEKLNFPKSLILNYIHDSKIKGLVHAKQISLSHTKFNIVSFLEDDIELDVNYFFEVDKAFKNNHKMIGCSGYILNDPHTSFFYRFFYRLNHIGIFKDPRPDIFYNIKKNKVKKATTNVINGGLSSWKKSIFKEFDFDVKNKFHMMEDFEFSTRVSRRFPNTLFILSEPKLYHYSSLVNRVKEIKLIELKIFEYIIYYKKNSHIQYSLLQFIVLFLGLLANEFIKSVLNMNYRFFLSFIIGTINGFSYKLKR